jgi:hypothetical protein
MHFGTFRLTDEAIGEPQDRLARACRDHAVTNFGVLGVGETRLVNLRAGSAFGHPQKEDAA